VTPAECRAIAARAIASGAITAGAAQPVCVRSVEKHPDTATAGRVLKAYGAEVRAVAKAHGVSVEAVAGRSAQYAAAAARHECWRRLVAGGSAVVELAATWGVSYRAVKVAVNGGRK